MPGTLNRFMKLAEPWFNTAAEGAWPTLCAATSDQVQGGDYYGPAKRRETAGPAVRVRSNRASRNRRSAERLWDLSVEMTGVQPGI